VYIALPWVMEELANLLRIFGGIFKLSLIMTHVAILETN
jgi:hypothetical protein